MKRSVTIFADFKHISHQRWPFEHTTNRKWQNVYVFVLCVCGCIAQTPLNDLLLCSFITVCHWEAVTWQAFFNSCLYTTLYDFSAPIWVKGNNKFPIRLSSKTQYLPFMCIFYIVCIVVCMCAHIQHKLHTYTGSTVYWASFIFLFVFLLWDVF